MKNAFNALTKVKRAVNERRRADVSILVALTVGLVIWIVAWAFGIKAFDAFLVTMLLVVRRPLPPAPSLPFVRQLLRRDTAPGTGLAQLAEEGLGHRVVLVAAPCAAPRPPR